MPSSGREERQQQRDGRDAQADKRPARDENFVSFIPPEPILFQIREHIVQP